MATRRWLVRQMMGHVQYWVVADLMPPILKDGIWLFSRGIGVPSQAVEALLPARYHLEPGGGPVELKG